MNTDRGARRDYEQNILLLSALLCLGALALLTGSAQTVHSEVEASLILFGTVEARELRLGSKVGGRLMEVLVAEGQMTSVAMPIPSDYSGRGNSFSREEGWLRAGNRPQILRMGRA